MIKSKEKDTKRGRKWLASLCLTAFTVTAFTAPIAPLRVNALPNKSYEERTSLQPLGGIHSIKSLLEWTPESDSDAPYNKSAIKLQERFTGNVVNPNANPEAKVMNAAITNANAENAPAQGSDSQDAYVFSYWQYIDSYVYWGGIGDKIFCIPTPDVVDAAHKNGVTVLATVQFPWGSREGYTERVREFLQKDKDGKFPVADKMIELAEYYGFDGYFINQESYGCNKEDADKMIELCSYIKAKSPKTKIAWYDSMSVNGPISYQDSLTDVNSKFLQNGKDRVTDEFFLNYNWNKSKTDKTVETANKVGRSPFDVFAGVDVQQNAYNTRFRVKSLLDDNNKLRTSLAMYCPNSTFSMAKDLEDFYVQDQRFWVGPTGDPANTDVNQNWVGIANYISDKSAIKNIPFVTNFNVGQGKKYYIDGNALRNRGWNNRSLQEYLPTWRWRVESKGNKLKPEFDFNDAYNGGSSLKISGNLQAANSNHIKLYSTDLNIKNDKTEISITYKTPNNKSNMKIGICFGDTNKESNYIFLDAGNGNKGEWTTKNISLKDYVGKKISAISLKFESSEDVSNYKINIGKIAVIDTSSVKKLPASKKVTLDDALFHNSANAEARIYWDKVEDTNLAFYEIYRVKSNGEREFIGATPNNAYYVSPFDRYGNEDKFNFEVIAVDKNGTRGEAKALTFKWQLPVNSTEVPDNTAPVNLALNKKVTVSQENSGEPAIKAVDGKVENNSKWCASNAYDGWLNIDLGETKTVQRWVVKHGECGGEGKDTNTSDFRLRVSKDGGKTYEDVDTVKDNTLAVTDRNLKQPVTGRYFQLYVDDSGKCPWTAIRIYEFELYEKPYIPITDPIRMNLVKATNNEGAKDEVIFTKVPVGNTIMLYKNINDTKPFASKTASAEDNGIVKFTNLDFGASEGRIFYAAKEQGKNASIKLSVPYDNETWKVTPVPDNFTILPYNAKSLSDKASYYAALRLGYLKEGDILRYYASIDDILPQKESLPVGEGDTYTILDRIMFNSLGGNLILQLKRAGMKESEKFVLEYNSKEQASTTGNFEINKELLEEAIKSAKQKADSFTGTEKDEILAAIKIAQDVLDNIDSKQPNLDEAMTKLNSDVNTIVKKYDDLKAAEQAKEKAEKEAKEKVVAKEATNKTTPKEVSSTKITSENLPKTGSLVGTNLLIGLGMTLSAIGFVYRKRK